MDTKPWMRHMTTPTVNLSPLPKQRFTDNNGNPLSGGKVFTYAAGTTTKQNSYTDSTGSTPNPNPVILDSRGEAAIWLDQSLSYKIVVSPSTDTDPPTNPYWTIDNIPISLLGQLENPANGYGADLVAGVGRVVNTISAVRLLSKTGVGKAFALGCNAAGDGGGGQYFYVASDTTSADNGGTILVAADGGRWYLAVSGPVSICVFGCDKTGVTPCDTALQAAFNWSVATGNKLTAPAGTFNLATGVTVPIFANLEGAGMGLTVFKASVAMTNMLNMNFSTDTVFSPITLNGFTLNGNGLATNGYNLRYAHNTVFSNIYIENCVNGAQEKDSFLGRRINLRITGCTTGMWLVGSNHSSSHVGCSYTGCSGTQLLVQSSGTANDGNSALSFIGCDIEYGTAGGNGADMLCSDAIFTACYLGENIYGDVLINRGGNVTVQGGTMFMGYTATTHLTAPIAGKTVIRNAQIGGQTYGTLSTLAGSAAGTALAGKVAFYDIAGFFPLGGILLSALGDVLDYGPQGTVYALRQGNQWTFEGNNITFSTAISNNQQTGTVLTAPGPTPLLGARSALSGNSGWQNGKPLYLVLVYQSSKPINVLLSGGAFGGAPTVNLATSLPATSGGVPQTAMCFQVNASTAAYTLLEVVQTSSAVGDTLTIQECFLSDGRMLNAGAANVGNIYKC